MYLKVRESPEGNVVAACDRELIGKVLEEGDSVLDLKAHSSFYVGEIAGQEQVRAALGDFASANLVGEKAVGVALKEGIVQKRDIKYINGVPHLQIYRL
ncbi:DUF424 family protein [Candidatus Micrarchaeota archaeon]|nr:DUF424 family protein [Candidatus Micrarchaeota archaeon]